MVEVTMADVYRKIKSLMDEGHELKVLINNERHINFDIDKIQIDYRSTRELPVFEVICLLDIGKPNKLKVAEDTEADGEIREKLQKIIKYSAEVELRKKDYFLTKYFDL